MGKGGIICLRECKGNAPIFACREFSDDGNPRDSIQYTSLEFGFEFAVDRSKHSKPKIDLFAKPKYLGYPVKDIFDENIPRAEQRRYGDHVLRPDGVDAQNNENRR